MQIHHKPTKIVVTGQSGSGKTTYVMRYLKNSPYHHVVVFDHKLEFFERENIQPEFNRENLVEHVVAGKRVISYSPLDDFPGNSQSGFEFICEWSYEIARASDKRFLFVCDEFNRFTDSNSVGWEFTQLIEDGRLWGLDFIGTAHGGNQIHNRIRSQFTEVVAFHTEDKTPLAFLEEYGFDVDEVRGLAIPGEFITKDCVKTKFVRGRLFSLTARRSDVSGESTNGDNPEIDRNEVNLDDSDNRHCVRGPSGHGVEPVSEPVE
jgi:hypothetical protein